jgi:azurin
MNAKTTRRQFMRQSVLVTGLGLLGVAASACGGAAVAPTAASTGKTFTFDLTSDDTVAFNLKNLSAEVGSKITVNLTNKSTDKRFNFVLAKPGKMLRVVTDGQSEGEATEYLKANDENVVAHTKFAGPGETVSITFEAPPAGEYPFFCTFPGYYTRLNGALIVK